VQVPRGRDAGSATADDHDFEIAARHDQLREAWRAGETAMLATTGY
jgi:hypothetical protein